jgi:hypothetical protein
MKYILVLALSVSTSAGLYACSDSHSHDESSDGGHTSEFASCQAIIDACHEYDVGEGPVHDCHDLAHDSTSEATCAAKKTSCLATCAAAGADASTPDASTSDASTSDASTSDASDASGDR